VLVLRLTSLLLAIQLLHYTPLIDWLFCLLDYVLAGDKGSQLDALREVAAAAAARHRRTPSYEDDQEEV
jgi:hypothetical protein